MSERNTNIFRIKDSIDAQNKRVPSFDDRMDEEARYKGDEFFSDLEEARLVPIDAIDLVPVDGDEGFPPPSPDMLADPLFWKIWEAIKTWDINVPEAYGGYCGATSNHVKWILDSINKEATVDNTAQLGFNYGTVCPDCSWGRVLPYIKVCECTEDCYCGVGMTPCPTCNGDWFTKTNPPNHDQREAIKWVKENVKKGTV